MKHADTQKLHNAGLITDMRRGGSRRLRHAMSSYHTAMMSLIGLLIVLAAGCSGLTTDEEADVRQAFGVPANMPMKDLGEVKLHAGIPKRVRIDRGMDCTITATMLTNGLSQMNLAYESKSEVIDGVKMPSHSEQSQLVLRPDMVPTGWRLCFFPKGQHFAAAMRPIITP